MSNFEFNLATYNPDGFSEGDLKLLKESLRDAYQVLKKHFDRAPRYKRPFNSSEAYKMHREAMLRRPSDFFRFKDEHVDILLDYKSRGTYLTVAVFGYKLLKFYDLKLQNNDSFSAGYDFYGRFQLSEFTSAVNFWRNCVKNYLDCKFADIHFTDIDLELKNKYRESFNV